MSSEHIHEKKIEVYVKNNNKFSLGPKKRWKHP